MPAVRRTQPWHLHWPTHCLKTSSTDGVGGLCKYWWGFSSPRPPFFTLADIIWIAQSCEFPHTTYTAHGKILTLFNGFTLTRGPVLPISSNTSNACQFFAIFVSSGKQMILAWLTLFWHNLCFDYRTAEIEHIWCPKCRLSPRPPRPQYLQSCSNDSFTVEDGTTLTQLWLELGRAAPER